MTSAAEVNVKLQQILGANSTSEASNIAADSIPINTSELQDEVTLNTTIITSSQIDSNRLDNLTITNTTTGNFVNTTVTSTADTQNPYDIISSSDMTTAANDTTDIIGIPSQGNTTSMFSLNGKSAKDSHNDTDSTDSAINSTMLSGAYSAQVGYPSTAVYTLNESSILHDEHDSTTLNRE